MPWLSGYVSRIKLTIDHTKIDENLSDFPVLVKLSSGNFDFSKSNSDGFDIRFTSDDGETLLKYERERHDNVGELAEYWVKIPSVSSSVDVDFYIYFRTSDTEDGADPTAVWDENFKGVWHSKNSLLNSEMFAENAPSAKIATSGVIPENIVHDSVTEKYWWVAQYNNKIYLAYADYMDGEWTLEGSAVLSEPGHQLNSPHIVKFGSYWYIYYGRDDPGNIYVQKSLTVNSGYSADGIDNPMIPAGGAGTWEERRTMEPYVFLENGVYYLFYMGESVGTLLEKTGYATSDSPTGPFTKYASNPVLSGDSPSGWDHGQDKAADPFVFKKDGVFYIGVAGCLSGKSGWETGFFKTTDFITFTEVDFNPILSRGASGNWDDFCAWRGAVSEFDGVYYFSYGGGDGSVYRAGMTILNFNSLSNRRVDDSTVNDNSGMKRRIDKPLELDGKVGKAQEYSGYDNYIDFGSDVSLQPVSVTLEVLAKMDRAAQIDAYGALVNMASEYDTKGYGLYIRKSDWQLWWSHGKKAAINLTGDIPADDTWFHFVLVYDSATGTKIYYNGALTATDATIGDLTYTKQALRTAGRAMNTLLHFAGVIDEIRVSNIGRSAAYVGAVKNVLDDVLLTYDEPEYSSVGSSQGLIF